MACQSRPRSAAAERQNPSPNQGWMNAVNGSKWDQLYTEQAVHIKADGSIVEGKDAIIKEIQSRSWQIKSIAITQTVIANRDSSYQYELGQFFTHKGERYHHLVIWNYKAAAPLRELEMIVKGETFGTDIFVQINQRRAQWIELCNQHNASNLVEQLYSEDAIYYNHKPIVRGHELITADYQYMNQPQYNLLLTPIIIAPVNEQLVYEIGQCSGSYGGKYILVWQKEADGKWYISIDANL